MENIGAKLMQELKELSDLEVQSATLLYAKFNRELENSYKVKIEAIEKNIDSQIEYYGKSVEEYSEQKNRILERYNSEFQKIYNQRKEQFINVSVEIQEIQANQKIAIANFKKIIEDRELFLQTSKYSEYIKRKKYFKHVIDTTLNHAEFDKYTKLLEELTDPLELYERKLEALVNKYNGYKEIIEQCETKLEECITATKEEFEEIVKYRSASLVAVKKGNFLMDFINKLINKLSGNSKLEKDVIQKMESELVNVENSNNEIINVISEQTITLIATIEQLRDTINSEFKLAMG